MEKYFNKKNKEAGKKYIDDNLNSYDEKTKDKIIATMKKYDVKWWRSDDSVEFAKYQLFEPVFMGDFEFFLEGLEKLLGRPVFIAEIALNKDEFMEEANIAIKKLEPGESLQHDEKYKADKINDSIKSIADYCVKNNKGLIKIDDDGPIALVPLGNKAEETLLDILDEIHAEKNK